MLPRRRVSLRSRFSTVGVIPMSKKRTASPEELSGRLKRNNVYTPDAVRDWAGRIRAGKGGIRLNEKFMLVAMSHNCNPRAVCELPVRYLADYIGVGLRQAQRIIQQLIRYELIASIDLVPQGRPVDVVRKFVLSTSIDPDVWEPKQGTSYATLRQAFVDRLKVAVVEKKITEMQFLQLASIHIVGIQSKRLVFVSPDADVTNAAFAFKKALMEMAATITGTEVLQIHMIPKKGYRG